MEYIKYLLEEILLILEREKKIYKSFLDTCPEGSLICDNSNGKRKYLQSVAQGKNAAGSYHYSRSIITDDPTLIRTLACKAYARKALKIIDSNLTRARAFRDGLKHYCPENIVPGSQNKLSHFLSDYRRLMDNTKATDQTLRLWADDDYVQTPYDPLGKKHITSRGLKVRSRAELLIAESLYKHDLPFRYEQILQVGKHQLAPDFTFLDKSGQEFFWEHAGMMHDPDYLDGFLWKRKLYEGAGVFQWTDMIYTFDVDGNVDMRQIEAIIKTQILPRVI